MHGSNTWVKMSLWTRMSGEQLLHWHSGWLKMQDIDLITSHVVKKCMYACLTTMSIGPKSCKGGRFFTSWLPCQWAKHGFEVDGFFTRWLPCQLDRKLGAGKVFAMVITMAMGKTRFWGFYMVITMSIGPMPTNITNWLAPKKKDFKKSMI